MTALLTYTLRACLPARRLIGLALLAVAALGLGLIARIIERPANVAFADVAGGALFPLVLPIAALVVGDAVMGAEIRKGTFHFTWLSPVSLGRIAVARWAGGTLVLGTVLGAAFALAALLAGAPDAAGPAAAAAVFGGAAYVALLEAVGAAFRRAAAISLALVFLGERLLGTALSGVAQWSPGWEGRAVFTGWTPGVTSREGIPDGTGAVVRLTLITIVGLLLTRWRLSRIKLTGGGD